MMVHFFLFFRNEPGAVGTPRWMPPGRPASNVVSGKVEKSDDGSLLSPLLENCYSGLYGNSKDCSLELEDGWKQKDTVI